MPKTEFAEVQHQLEVVVSELKTTTDRKNKLLDMRLLVAEADRLTLELPDE